MKENIKQNSSRFNLEKPEKYSQNKIKKIGVRESIKHEVYFDLLNKTGQRIQDSGSEKVIKYVDYEISPNINLRVRGDEYTYTEKDKESKNNYITALYKKDIKELYKMSFNSENPIFAGKAIIDMINRIPVGTKIFRGETNLSTDSFPLLLNTFSK